VPGDVYCVVPTFGPESAVIDLIKSIAPQCSVLVVDDASPCTYDPVLHQIGAISGVQALRHSTNAGIGRGLNNGLAAAREAGNTWLLTVHQDTVLPADYVSTIVEAARLLGLS